MGRKWALDENAVHASAEPAAGITIAASNRERYSAAATPPGSTYAAPAQCELPAGLDPRVRNATSNI